MLIIRRRPLTCLLLQRHKWQTISTEDGSNRYNKCRKCGKESWQPYGEGLGSIGTSFGPVL